jgi:hypothetical protein
MVPGHFVGDTCEAGAMSAAADRRGLLKLMLKMPALRGQLQYLSVRDEGMLSLCGAFDDATDTLERLRRGDLDRHHDIVLEYENICAEIEQEIIKICMGGSTFSN